MPVGSLYGYEIDSELPLGRLNRSPGTRGKIRVAEAAEPLAAPQDVEPVDVQKTETGEPWFVSYELAASCLLRMPPVGSFLLEPEELQVTVQVGSDEAELLEHRIVSTAVCTMLAMRGDLALHAAGIETRGQAVLICGASLRGKSTLAATLGSLGHPLLAEDGSVIDVGNIEPVAFAGARGVRMRPVGDVRPRSALLAPDPGPREPEPCPVGALVLLAARGQALRVECLDRTRALTSIAQNLIHSGGYAAVGAGFERLAHVLRTVPAFEASLPDDLAALPEAAQSLLDALDMTG
jgi:hypothetical protein